MRYPARLPLTAKEVKILELAAQGNTKAKIGAELFRSPCTVKNHLARIFEKLEVHNTTAAVAKWLAPEKFP